MLREKSMKSGEEKKYSYDSFGRMVHAEVPVESPSTREFQVQINRYDGEGLRHEMEENGRLIKFLYNEDREVVAEETGNGTITRYIRGLGIISSDSEEAKTYYHYVSDEQGSITHVLSEDAEILNHYNYDAFGNIIEKTEQVENRFCYNGEMLDSITQQYYLRARFYNPVIGRFTQEDTYYRDGLNLYQYCQANPLGYVDPSGHNCETTQNRYNSNEEQHPKANAVDAYQSATEKKSVKKDGSESGSGSVKNWKGQEVKIPDGHIMSPRDPSFSAKPITEAGPYTSAQRDAFLDGNSAGTKLAPHHRHQIPVRDGGVIDELPGPGHPSGNQHTAGSPSRHPAKSIFNSESGGNVLRANEITQHWIDKGNRLIEVEPGVWIDPGF